MRRVRYGVGMSLDGYIAGASGELDYLVSDPIYDQGRLELARSQAFPSGLLIVEYAVRPFVASAGCN